MRSIAFVTLLALSASCTRHGLPTGSEGVSGAGARADTSGCLHYPENVVPPVSGTLTAGSLHAVPRVLVAASGRIVLLDDRWRIMVWNPAAGREAVLLPGASSIPVAGSGDVLFQRNPQGSVMQLRLQDAMLSDPISEACGKAGPVSRIRGAADRPVVGLTARAAGGGAVIQFGEGISPDCRVAYQETERGWTLADAQASRDLLVITEFGPGGAARAVFHRHGNGADRRVPIDLGNIELAADSVVFWSWESATILVGSTRDPIPTLRPVELFARLPLNRSCIDVESTVGRFVLFRNECVERDAGPEGVQRVLFDATAGRVVAKLDGIDGPVGVAPDGRTMAAGPDGICPVRGR